MNQTTRPLDGFEERLLHELRDVVAQRAEHAPRWRPRLRRWSRGLAAAAVLVCASGTAGGLALAGTFSSGTIGPQAWVDGQRVTPEAAMTPDQTANLEILRRPRVASDALDAYTSQFFTNSPAAAQGVNVALSRRAQGITNGAAWVIPGNSGTICLNAENAQAVQMNTEPGPWQQHTRVYGASGVTACTTAAAINAGWFAGYASGSDTPGVDYTGGIVPDGVTQVSVGLADGSTITMPVHENVWMGDVPGTPTSVSFNGPNGPVTGTN
jgi:hypothetical protein